MWCWYENCKEQFWDGNCGHRPWLSFVTNREEEYGLAFGFISRSLAVTLSARGLVELHVPQKPLTFHLMGTSHISLQDPLLLWVNSGILMKPTLQVYFLKLPFLLLFCRTRFAVSKPFLWKKVLSFHEVQKKWFLRKVRAYSRAPSFHVFTVIPGNDIAPKIILKMFVFSPYSQATGLVRI
jgi:hypothetical protein